MSNHSITNLIRQYCDGELNDEQIAQVQKHLQAHPEDQAIIESERKLRKRIEAVVKADCPHAPAGLVDQIKSEFTKQSVSSDSEEETYAYSPRSWSFGPNKANVFAVAASIALVVGAVLFGIFGNPIDRRNAVDVSQTTAAIEAAESVGLEHIKLATNRGSLDALMGCSSCDDARSAYCRQLGSEDIPKIDLSAAGYEFKNGMECAVPHCETSYHLIFSKSEGMGLVSIHIARDTRNLNLDAGEPFDGKTRFKTSRFYLNRKIMGQSPCVIAFRDDEIMYLVMACISSDTEQVIDLIQDSIVNQGR